MDHNDLARPVPMIIFTTGKANSVRCPAFIGRLLGNPSRAIRFVAHAMSAAHARPPRITAIRDIGHAKSNKTGHWGGRDNGPAAAN